MSDKIKATAIFTDSRGRRFRPGDSLPEDYGEAEMRRFINGGLVDIVPPKKRAPQRRRRRAAR